MKEPQLLTYSLGRGILAFSTMRAGGCSQGTFASFNINRYCGDDEAAIAQNRQLLCTSLGIEDDCLIMPHQTHNAESVVIDEAYFSLSVAERTHLLEGVDALITKMKGVCIGVSTADCVPLLFFDAEHDAVAAVHAGWRGTVARIGECVVDKMKTTFATRPEALHVCIGPSISQEAFEVGDEVYEAFSQAAFPLQQIARRYPSGKWHLDLWEANRLSLLQCGIPGSQINVAGVCTYQNVDRFFSARRQSIHSGRIFSGILITKK